MATASEAAQGEYLYAGGQRIRVFGRLEFFTKRWRYKAGQHVAFLAPTQDGKTTLAFQLLMYTIKATLMAIVLVMKPRDETPAKWTRHLGFSEVSEWPPPRPWPWQKKPPGYTLWPRHTFNPKIDNANMAKQFAAALYSAYAKGNTIVFADEVYGLIAELPQKPEDIEELLVAIWTRGSGMGVGLWAATQKPSGTQGKGVPGFMYSNSHHLFLSFDPDKRSRQRYGEIGGVDPKLLEELVTQLNRYQFVYINRGDEKGGPYICVIDAR